jgi:hypothetical protein
MAATWHDDNRLWGAFLTHKRHSSLVLVFTNVDHLSRRSSNVGSFVCTLPPLVPPTPKDGATVATDERTLRDAFFVQGVVRVQRHSLEQEGGRIAI